MMKVAEVRPGFKIRVFALAMFALFLIFVALGCNKNDINSAGDDSSTEPTGEGKDENMNLVTTRTMASGETTELFTVDVPEGSVSLTITADGIDASDMDISNLIDPTGLHLISEDILGDPIGYSFTQGPGQSSVQFTLPHSDRFTFIPGTYSYAITHYDSMDGQPRDVSIYTYIKSSPGSLINVNIFLVDIDDYKGPSDPALRTLLARFRTALGFMGLTLGEINVIELTGDDASRLTFVDLDTDLNLNAQSDDMDELFKLSSQANNEYANFFLVRSISPSGVLGISGGIPGPQITQGTTHSGVVVNLFGGLSRLTSKILSVQGDTMAHELGHFLGLFHTTERPGTFFDPISDTPECTASDLDTDGDGIVSAAECEGIDGPNIMFWSLASYPQETVSDIQKRILSLNPAVK